MRSVHSIALVVLSAVLATAGHTQAAAVLVANNSFESPAINNTDPSQPGYNKFGAVAAIDSWTRPADNNSGGFVNSALTDPSHIGNADGNQLAFLCAIPNNAISQDLAATYDVDSAYTLRVGVATSYYQPPASDATLTLSLYYLAADGTRPTIAASTISLTDAGVRDDQLIDFSTSLPAVQTSDAWAGRPIGILINPGGSGGFWDLDNVRLTAAPEPATLGLVLLLLPALVTRR